MAKRDGIFQQFGPLLLEKILRAQLDENNLFRSKLGLPAKSLDDLLTDSEEKEGEVTRYPWMDDE